MSRFWRGLMLGGALGALLVVWMNRRPQPATFRERVWRSASHTAGRARRRMGNMLQVSRRRASQLLAQRR